MKFCAIEISSDSWNCVTFPKPKILYNRLFSLSSCKTEKIGKKRTRFHRRKIKNRKHPRILHSKKENKLLENHQRKKNCVSNALQLATRTICFYAIHERIKRGGKILFLTFNVKYAQVAHFYLEEFFYLKIAHQATQHCCIIQRWWLNFRKILYLKSLLDLLCHTKSHIKRLWSAAEANIFFSTL